MASSNDEPLDEDSLQELYTWIDEIPLSRPKRNISRDFSDGGRFILPLLNSILEKNIQGNLSLCRKLCSVDVTTVEYND